MTLPVCPLSQNSKIFINNYTICISISLKTRTYFEFQSLTNDSLSFSYTLLQVHSNTHMTWNIEANKCHIKWYGTNFTLDNYGTNIVCTTVQIGRYHAIRSQQNCINKTTCQDNSFRLHSRHIIWRRHWNVYLKFWRNINIFSSKNISRIQPLLLQRS